jgi:hypothetical protein
MVAGPLGLQYRFACLINPLKTKRICFMQGLSAHRAVNILHFGYNNQSLNIVLGKSCCWF